MRSVVHILLVIIALGSYIQTDVYAQTVRIMPMGNSITYDHNSFDDSNPRPTGDRISYRYKLYQLLNETGLDFDFVGNEDAGNNYFQNTGFDDNAGFPGIETWELANLINTGYNGYTHQYVSPGPYLSSYPTDIILLHIGTNNLITSPDQVEDILDNIRFHDGDVIVLVARIVNRKSYHSSTTTFNNNVELMVNARGDNRIKMVNIETGAGINYSADMIDNWHPNQFGYDKMAAKWYEAIMNLNQAPVVSYIPTQVTDKGEAFPNLSLDQYVADVEDPDFVLAWTYEQEPDSKLTLSIDASRILHVTPAPDWSGVETVTLKVKDSGSGAFVQNASVDVVYMVDHVNSAPVVTSTPPTSILQGEEYSYVFMANDIDGDSLIYSAVELPSWLNFNSATHTLGGIPEHSDVGGHAVILRVSDGEEIVDQSFQIQVEDSNDPPVVTSSANAEVYQDHNFAFTITADDLDGDDLTYNILQKPSWLNFNSSLHILSGKPTNDEVGEYDLTVQVSDGTVDVFEPLQITVMNVNDLPVITSTPPSSIGIGESYIYRLTATDIDEDQELVFSALNMPDWLNFTTSSVDALLYGIPTVSDLGSNLVILQVADGSDEVVQSFNLRVTFPTDIDQNEQDIAPKAYPNPAHNMIRFEFTGVERTTIHIYNSTGILQSVFTAEFAQDLEADITNLPTGIYIYKVYQNGMESIGKFIKH